MFLLELARRAFVALLIFWSPPPEAAAYAVAQEWGVAEMVEPLVRICRRESAGLGNYRCAALRAHRGDASASRKVYKRAVKAGWLDPECQPYARGEWSTRSQYGLMAAYHVRRVAACAPYWSLDIPIVSSRVAADKLWRICSKPRHRRIKANRSWEGSDCAWMKRRCKLALRTKRSTKGCRGVWSDGKNDAALRRIQGANDNALPPVRAVSPKK